MKRLRIKHMRSKELSQMSHGQLIDAIEELEYIVDALYHNYDLEASRLTAEYESLKSSNLLRLENEQR